METEEDPEDIEPLSPKELASPSKRSSSQPRTKVSLRSPTPTQLLLSSERGRLRTGERRITTASVTSRPPFEDKLSVSKTPTRRVGFAVQKMKTPAVHMSIDFGGPSVKVQKDPEPIMPTPVSREAPLLQVNRPQTGWNCSSDRYKKVKMTKRDMKALDTLIKASRTLPVDHRAALKVIKEAQSRPLIQPPLNDDKMEKRGLRFKEI